jgi:PiT family inorganic phosphate transporter
LIGALASSGAVAFGIIALLPSEMVINIGSAPQIAMVVALLASAIMWNLGTWYFGLPASSSHTLIGSILGVGLANTLMSHDGSWTQGVNWAKAQEVGLALMVSPLVGFTLAALLLLAAKALIRNPALYRAPEGNQPPPWWIRSVLMLTCTGVSYAHGSNDGQKGMGVILLILVGILPGAYALNLKADAGIVQQLAGSAATLATSYEQAAVAPEAVKAPATDLAGAATTTISAFIRGQAQTPRQTSEALAALCRNIAEALRGVTSLDQVPVGQRGALRSNIYLVSAALAKAPAGANAAEAASQFRAEAKAVTQYIPTWVKFAVALALGLGTMIGWKRIVVTVGEKIGKEHLTYAQGAAAEMVAMGTILAADRLGLPVSTTHVLSSGIAGTMAANNSGLQMRTLRNILLAWVLTLPICVFLGALLFAFALNVVFTLGWR